MSLRWAAEQENADLRHAGMDCRHRGSQDASGDIHVNRDPSTPCWNEAIEGFWLNCIGPLRRYFQRSTRRTRAWKIRTEKFEFRNFLCALRDFFGESAAICLRLCGTKARYLYIVLTILPLVPSCRTAELEKQAQLIKEQDAELARQRAEIEALKASQQAEKKKLSDCNRAFRDYFDRAQAAADREGAIALYRQGVALCPDDDVARYELGKLLAAEGLSREAEMEFASALKINPAFTDAKARLDALRKSR